MGVWNIGIHEKDHDICTVTERGMKRWYHSASCLIADLRLDCKVSAYVSKATVDIASLPFTGRPRWACWIADFTFKDDNPDAYLAFVMCIRSYQHYIHDRAKRNEMSKELAWLKSNGKCCELSIWNNASYGIKEWVKSIGIQNPIQCKKPLSHRINYICLFRNNWTNYWPGFSINFFLGTYVDYIMSQYLSSTSSDFPLPFS